MVRKSFSIVFKFIVFTCSVVGIVLSCLYAQEHGYSGWERRLMYFTQMSNLWIALTFCVIAILRCVGHSKGKKIVPKWLYVLKYIFTVSITLTGIIFCCFLAPFAETAGYLDAWATSSIFTHVVVPVLSIIDHFIDDYNIVYKNTHIYLSLIPPFLYALFASIANWCGVDFGRGDTFPYPFLNYYSDAGFFGFAQGNPPQVGVFYWLIFISLLVLGIAWLYYYFHPRTRKERLNDKQIKK